MTMWILALVFLASEAGLGLRQGAIRAAFSFGGIVLGALLANPLGHLLKPVFAAIGFKHPLVLWLAPPVVVFFIILILFKVAGYAVHRHAEVHFKYKAGDLLLALWTRMISRVGMCVALVNGALYLILLSFVIYTSSYWSVQLATAEGNPRTLKLLNRLGKDSQSTGMAKVGRAIDRMPPLYYETADLAGLIYNNPALKPRMYAYPLFVDMSEQPDYESLINSEQMAQAWRNQTPVMDVLKSSSAYEIFKTPDRLIKFWDVIRPNLDDLEAYATTGQSPKYGSEKILGRWNFDVNGTIGLLRRAKPNMTSKEMAQIKNWVSASFSDTSLVVLTDQRSILKNYPRVRVTPGEAPQTEKINVPGRWTKADDRYILSYVIADNPQEAGVNTDGDRLSISGPGLELAFERAY